MLSLLVSVLVRHPTLVSNWILNYRETVQMFLSLRLWFLNINSLDWFGPEEM